MSLVLFPEYVPVGSVLHICRNLKKDISFLVGITAVSDRIVLGQLVPQENPVLPGERKYGEKI